MNNVSTTISQAVQSRIYHLVANDATKNHQDFWLQKLSL